jgi:hypothetical protein
MVCTLIYYFSASKGKYLELATSSHPMEAKGYEIRSNFISFLRELTFLEPNPQDFAEVDVLDFLKLE